MQVTQQVIHFIENNNVTSSDNESLNNDSSDSESVASENGQNGNGNCVQIPISNYEQDTEHETDFEMRWEWIFHSDPGSSVGPFLGEEMLLMDQEKNEHHYFFEALFEAEMWNHTAHKTNKYMQVKTNIYCFIFFYFFNMYHDTHHIFNMFHFSRFHESLNVLGSATPNCCFRFFQELSTTR